MMATMTREEAEARRAELWAICEASGADDAWAFYEKEFEQLNRIVGRKDCLNCGRDFDYDYPDKYCPWCVAVYLGGWDWDWEPSDRPTFSIEVPDFPEEVGTFIPWCRCGQGEMRCMYPEGHTGSHRFRFPRGRIVEWA